MNIELLLAELRSKNVKLAIKDDKLICILPDAGIDDTLLGLLKEHKEELKRTIQEKTNFKKYQAIPKSVEMGSYPLSPSQKRLWMLSQFEGGSQAYNMSYAIKLIGELPVVTFEKSFKQLIEHHEVLRTVFKNDTETDEVRQFIIPVNEIEFKITQADFSAESDFDQKLGEYINYKINEEFNLEKAPLVRASLIKIADNEHIFLFGMHHIISDGLSMELLISEIVQRYDNLLQGKDNSTIAPLKFQYKDYAVWLNEEMQKEKYLNAEKYWLNKFKGELPILNLPAFKARPAIQTFNGDTLEHTFSEDFANKLKSFSEDNKATLFMTFMAGVKALLYRYSGQDDIIVGIPIAGREHPDLGNQIGLYINTLVIRTQFNDKNTFAELLQIEKDNLIAANEHQMFSFDELVRKLNVKRDLSRSALFDVLVNFQNQSQNSLNIQEEINGLKLEKYEYQKKSSQFDISFNFSEYNNQITLNIEYNTDIYGASWATKIVTHFEALLLQAIANKEKLVEQIDFLTDEEKNQVLVQYNNTKVVYPKDKTVVDLFSKQVLETPNNIALKDSFQSYTYSELDRLSGKIANYLRSLRGEEDKSPIAVLMNRSSGMVAVLLGILKSGRPYITLDPIFPEERLNYIINNSEVKIVISAEEYSHIGKEVETTIKSEDLFAKITDFKETIAAITVPQDTAYIIYTSGSTGNPKGVEIGHQSLVNFLTSIQQKPGIGVNDILFSVTTYSFDISILEFFVPIISGATLYVAEQEILVNPDSIIQKIEEIKPTVLQATPSFYQMLFNADWQGSKALKVLCGGDLLNEELAKKLVAACSEVWNMYGPTETTIWSSLKQIEFPKDASNIGKPINNTQFYLLDKYLKTSPLGSVGGIYIGGDGLAKGYYKNEILTKEKFIKSPFSESEFIYETGDLGKWNEKGEIQFLGRNDNQVKIRGYRIELGDIETALSQYSKDLKEVVVVARELNAEKALVVYYVSENNIEKTALRTYLQGKLPEYMVPNIYVALESLPLTPNGKIDRKSLPGIANEDITRKEYVAPTNETEQIVAEIWQRLLNLETIGSTDDFFELGGHSILLTRLLTEYQKIFRISVNLKALYVNTSLKDHAVLINESKKEKSVAVIEIEKLADQKHYDLSPSQVRYWLLYKIQEKSQEFNIYSTQQLPADLNIQAFEKAFNKLVERHEILRTVFTEDSGIPKQKVLSHIPVTIPAFTKDSEIRNEIFDHEFDLEAYPLFKVGILENEASHTLYFNIHHIISDGWSIDVISRDLMHIYNAVIAEENANLPELPIQYKDYAAWQNNQLQSSGVSSYETYWKEKLSGSLPYLQLPSDYASKIKTNSSTSSSYTVYLDAVQKKKIDKLSKESSISSFALFVATLKILLFRLTAEEDIIIGIPAANRNHYQLKDLVGCFINTLVLRDRINENDSFLVWLQQVNETLINALANQNYPFEKLLELIKVTSEDNRFPLCPVFINMLDFDLESTQTITDFNPIHKTLESSPKFDLECYVKTFSNGYVINCVYDHNLFKKETIEYWIEAYLSIIDQVVENEQDAVNTIRIFENYIPQAEDLKPANSFDYFESIEIEQSIAQRFEKQAQRFPDRIAVYANQVSLTYTQLNNSANYLATQIQEKTNPETRRIALLLNHNETCVIGMLGVLKAGYTYVPIDANSPLSRIQYIMEDSGCKHLVCNATTIDVAHQLVKDVPELAIIKIEDDYNLPEIANIEQVINSDTEAYILYTSGSTGLPKGVIQSQRNVLHFIRVYTNNIHIAIDDNLSVFSTYTFDASVKDIYGAILNGATVSIYDIVENGLETLPQWLLDQNISVIHMVPTIYRNFLKGLAKNEILPNIRLIDLGGESCHKTDFDLFQEHFAEGAFLVNDYGPTESTIVAQKFLNHKSQLTRNNVPLGKAVVDTEIFLLDENNNRKGVYQTGEIVFRSDYLSLGYLNREELTSKAFVSGFESQNKRIYKSGDVGKMLPTGEIEFLQRKDSQVKLNGLRIELSEIEYQLEQIGSIKKAVVLVKEVQDISYITAYIKVNENQEINEVKVLLGAILPKYMIPSIYLVLEEFPLTRTGKIDRNALPNPVLSDLRKVVYVAPKNELENQLVTIWAETLNLNFEAVGTENSFFELGGHSLVVSQVINRIHKQLNKQITFREFFSNPTIQLLSAKLKEDNFVTIPNAPFQESYALSASQKRLWILSQFEGGSQAYNMSYAVKLKGDLDSVLFHKAFRALIDRHEVLRTLFKYDIKTEEVRQFILPVDEINPEFDTIQLKSGSALENEIEIDDYFQTRCNEAFNLEKAPLLRSGIIEIKDQEHILFLSIHHIISDGWSMELIVKEIVLIYNSLIQGEDINLPELKIQYKDYAAWLNSEVEKEKYKVSEQYWLEQFSGTIPVLELPAFRNRPLVKTYNGDYASHSFSSDLLKKLHAFSSKHDVTLFMTLLTGINVLLSKYSGQDDIIIGTPVAGRDHADLENQIGIYLNTLALRTTINSDDDVLELLDFEKKMILSAYENQNYPFDEMVEKLELKRDTSRSALFDVMIVLQSQSKLSGFNNDNQGLTNIEVERYNLKREVSKFDLTFEFVEESNLLLRINYNTDLYDSSFIDRLIQHFEIIISKIIDAPKEKIKNIDYLPAAEKAKVLFDFNATKVDYSKEETIVTLFEDQVKKTPDDIALVFDEVRLTYAQFNAKANQFASYLKRKYNVQAHDKVGIKQDRSETLVLSILAVLKSGGAYVPIDSAYPQERIDFIEKDSNCKVIIDAAEWNNFVLESENYAVGNLDQKAAPENSAYVIYTSGSTGNPKGVDIAHASLANYLLWGRDYYSANGSRSLDFGLFTSLSFDLTVTSLFLPIISGGTLTVFETTGDISKLLTAYLSSDITSIKLTPAHISILESLDLSATAVELAVVGGEALLENQVKILKNLNPNIRIINEYGPTEATVGCIVYDIKDAQETVLIGKPIANTQIYILDESHNPSAIGVTGELYIAGNGLARGYINRPELMAEKFITNPFNKEVLMYKTGDLGRWLPNGNIDYTGRIDDQVKIRGYRIELGELENRLSKIAGISHSVVAVKDDKKEKYLVAYYVAETILDKILIQKELSEVLPDYMLPGYYIQLQAIPLTTNGKVDKKALPDTTTGDLIRKEYIAARNSTEQQVTEIWQDVLKINKIGIKDNFFELGGHSLTLIKVVNQLNRQLSKNISITEFFQTPTIEGIARKLEGFTYQAIENVPDSDHYPLTASQLRFWILSQFAQASLAYNIPATVLFKGDLDIQKLEQSFQVLIARHEILRTFFRSNDKGDVHQYIVPAASLEFSITREDFSSLSDSEQAVKAYLHHKNSEAFDLEKAPLLRSAIIKTNKKEHVFYLSMHHIISDGWSMELMIKEIVVIYNSLVQDKNIELPELKIQYKDYAAWLNNGVQKEKYKVSEQYWLQQLSGTIPVLELPVFKNRPLIKTYNGNDITYTFPKDVFKKLKVFSNKYDATLFMTLVTSINALLSRYSGQDDIIIGTPVAGRDHVDLENQIGLYLNTLVLRTSIHKDSSVLELLEFEKKMILAAYENQNYPFDELVEKLQLKRDTSRSALFDVMVVLQNQSSAANSKSDDLELANLEVENYTLKRDISKFDLTFEFREEESLSLRINYNTDIYDQGFIERLIQHLEIIVATMIDSPEEKIQHINYLTAGEKNQIELDYNAAIVENPKGKSIVDLFEEQVKNTPDETALVFDEVKLTYKQLNEEANQFGAYLTDKFNAQPEDLFGIKLDRSEKLIIILLGVLKSGAAYLPLDSGYPQERLDYIEKDSNCKAVITEKEWKEFYSESKNYPLDNLQRNASLNHTAYVIYTSGSTGNPKGVVIEHAGIVNTILSQIDIFGIKECKNSLQFASFSFDASVSEIFITLLSGNTLFVLNEETRKDVKLLEKYIVENKIEIATIPPALFKLIEVNKLKDLKVLVTAGEAAVYEKVVEYLNHGTFFNAYGPTETSICATIFKIEKGTKLSFTSIPIGKPIANTQVYVLNESLSPCPVGVSGELFVSGYGLARGYLYNQMMTDQKFLPNPFRAGELMYRTGDLVRKLPNGDIDYLGRIDDQVKIRGYRIELGEIESLLSGYSEDIVQGAVEAVLIEGEKTLVAYYVAQNNIDKSDLKDYLSKRLPDYMVPSFYVALDKILLTPNGKTDRKALPSVTSQDIIHKKYVAPRNELEEQLIKIIASLINIDESEVGINDNFFDLGINSLKLVRIQDIIKSQLGFEINISMLFEFTNIKNLADKIYGLENNTQIQPEIQQENILEQFDEFLEELIDKNYE
ncbi:non-ribosomal peptide synthetase [Flavobacterium branchiicola]|uniref:Non-ribosomal peptide synthetase n=1 Tax=Flavobacterium branchiicola TaxID=1114875 RepID=A0ABV9PMJ8_9FLAO|nr:non-ribosomal peptide synthetase [Flavobacterium branchiicola]MBS7256341.1 amino acid adenylation domain-containing protein [Flavobacterium branchiicola]